MSMEPVFVLGTFRPFFVTFVFGNDIHALSISILCLAQYNILSAETCRKQKQTAVTPSCLNRASGGKHANVHIHCHGASAGQAILQAPGTTIPHSPMYGHPPRAHGKTHSLTPEGRRMGQSPGGASQPRMGGSTSNR